MPARPDETGAGASAARLARLALAMAAASLLLGAYAVLVAPRADGAPGDAARACEDGAARREIAELRRALGAPREPGQGTLGAQALRSLSERVVALEAEAARRREAGPEAGDAARADAAAPRADVRRFVRFDPPSPALRLRQLPDGAIAVTNTDPSLTGKYLVVPAHAEDGAVEQVPIVVPAPGQ